LLDQLIVLFRGRLRPVVALDLLDIHVNVRHHGFLPDVRQALAVVRYGWHLFTHCRRGLEAGSPRQKCSRGCPRLSWAPAARLPPKRAPLRAVAPVVPRPGADRDPCHETPQVSRPGAGRAGTDGLCLVEWVDRTDP